MRKRHLFCFGLGYTTHTLAHMLLDEGWKISGTCRKQEKKRALSKEGITACLFDGTAPLDEEIPEDVTHILQSIPPDEKGDAALRHHADKLRALPNLQWCGYLSTTGVYGDHQGNWVDETTPTTPIDPRAHRRVNAEHVWSNSRLPTHIFRLSGIYGPGRNTLDRVRNGSAQRIDKPDHVFCRIHVTDIAQILMASFAHPKPGSIYNCADDLPAAQAEVTAYACTLLGVKPPPLIPYAQAELSEMASSFYASCRRVKNNKIKEELAVQLRYPTYKEGLTALV